MEETIVKVDHLSHRYSVQWAIRDINFEVPASKWTCPRAPLPVWWDATEPGNPQR